MPVLPAWVSRTRLALVCLLLASCASEVYRVPTKFSPADPSTPRLMVLRQTIEVTPASGYRRALKAGSRWRYAGRIPQGRVYSVLDDVFMLEGKHMHEAYCVLADDATLVGFFLPVEQAFSPLSVPVRLPIDFQ